MNTDFSSMSDEELMADLFVSNMSDEDLMADLGYDQDLTVGEEVSGALRSAASGVTLAYGDEIEAFLTPGDYRENKDEIKASMEKYNKAHPILSTGVEIGAGLLGAGKISAANKLWQLANKGSLAAKTAKLSGVGAGSGALYGSGLADTVEDIPKSAAQMGALGAALGPAGPLIGAAGRATGRGLNKTLKPAATWTADTKVGQSIGKAKDKLLKETIDTPIHNMYKAAGEKGKRFLRDMDYTEKVLEGEGDSLIKMWSNAESFMKSAGKLPQWVAAGQKGKRSALVASLRKAGYDPAEVKAFNSSHKDYFNKRADIYKKDRKGFKELNDYSPTGFRSIDDFNAYTRKKFGANAGQKLTGMQKAIQDLNSKGLTGAAYDKELNSILTRGGVPKTDYVRSQYAKQRKGFEATEDTFQHFNTPLENAVKYNRQTAAELAERRALGAGATLEGSIGAKAREWGIQNNPEAMKSLRLGMEGRLSPKARTAPNSTLQKLRDVGYMGTIANPLGAMMQIADIPAAMARQGVRPGAKAIKDAASDLWNRKAIKEGTKDAKTASPLSVGIRNVTHDLGQSNPLGSSGKILDTLMRASGFSSIDTAGKRIQANAYANRLQNTLKHPNGEGVLKKEMEDWVPTTGKDWDNFVKAVSKKDFDNADLRRMMYNAVADVQPISLSDMPSNYLKHPNMRLAYQLKTWAIRFVNTIREDVQRGNGTQALKYYAGVMAASTGVDSARDMVKAVRDSFAGGEDWKPEDIPDTLAKQILGSMFLSKYSIDQIASGNFSDAAAGLVAPAGFSVVGGLVKDVGDVMTGDGSVSSLRYVPGIGALAPR